jgi:mannose-6-phosphate isomerase-like protein (cupin superfamily)
MIAERGFNPSRTFVQLEPGGSVTALKVDKNFWAGLRSRRIEGHLAGLVPMYRDFSWEMHPDGDELLCVVSGAISVVLQQDGAENTTEVSAGRAFVVPRGIWHRVLVREAGKLVFCTPGPRTEHRSARRAEAGRSPTRGTRRAKGARRPTSRCT